MLTSAVLIWSLAGTARADDRDWIRKTNALDCWRAIRNRELNDSELYPSSILDNGTILETPTSPPDVVAVIHTTEGTITVSKNGSCSRDPAGKTQDYIAQKLRQHASELASYKKSGPNSFERELDTNGSGSGRQSMRTSLYAERMDHAVGLLTGCAQAAGPIGEASRQGIAQLRGIPKPSPSPTDAGR